MSRHYLFARSGRLIMTAGMSGLLLFTGLPASGRLSAEDEIERPPIRYSQSVPANRVSALQSQINDGQFDLPYDETFGYLPALLHALEIPVESQMLVFSKTSLQLRRISPATPRAVYFSDDVYVGFCQNGDVLEVSAVDPKLGTVFYSLSQEPKARPQFRRHTEACLVCHSSSRTAGVPGHLVRSLFVDTEGTPILSTGSRIVDHTTPLEHRWGGWYVTGTHGSQRHLGNLVIAGRRVSEPVDNSSGQNITDLSDRFDVDRYLSPHSDIVALMILEHQALTHNRITKASFATRQALAHETMLNDMLGNPPGTRLDSTTRRIQSVGNELVDALLLAGEATLTDPVSGTSRFSEVFTRKGPRDHQGRSLRDLDLQSRLFRYPCSYLIYSDTFRALPQDLKDFVWQRLREVLSGRDSSERFSHLSPDDRAAIAGILRETIPDLPADWTDPDAWPDDFRPGPRTGAAAR